MKTCFININTYMISTKYFFYFFLFGYFQLHLQYELICVLIIDDF